MKLLIAVTIIFSFNVSAQNKANILINKDLLQHMNIPYQDSESDLALVAINSNELDEISHHAHDFNRCGGYELIDESEAPHALTQLETEIYNTQMELLYFSPLSQSINYNADIYEATQALEASNLKKTVEELSQFKSRSSRGNNSNKHVLLMKDYVDQIIDNSELKITSLLIDHSRTKQKTLKARIEGSSRPDEIIVLGGHLDSTSFFNDAPGADDNASGSANLLEVLRVLALGEQPERTIEIFWYAAEEVGLVGSSEIAKSYKDLGIDVIAVMQLDMTGFAGSGLLNIGNISDFTTPWLQQLLIDLNDHYVNAVVHQDKCGYGCSDHASWYRQGYNTVFPIESKFKQSNKSIHSARDTIDKLNFEHSLAFAKLALSLAMELANSDQRNPAYQ